LYRDHPDAGVHSACEWLIRHWHCQHDLGAVDRDLKSKEPRGARAWYVNSEGHTMACITDPVKFLMGPEREPGKQPGQQQHLEKPEHSFAIATKEVTVEQFSRFRKKDHGVGTEGINWGPTCPVELVSFADAMRYCLWLSRKEKIGEDQLCYEEMPGSGDI